MIRRPKPPKHACTRNELRKTAPNAVHEVNPPGTKFTLRILKRRMSKQKAREQLGLVTTFVTQETEDARQSESLSAQLDES